MQERTGSPLPHPKVRFWKGPILCWLCSGPPHTDPYLHPHPQRARWPSPLFHKEGDRPPASVVRRERLSPCIPPHCPRSPSPEPGASSPMGLTTPPLAQNPITPNHSQASKTRRALKLLALLPLCPSWAVPAAPAWQTLSCPSGHGTRACPRKPYLRPPGPPSSGGVLHPHTCTWPRTHAHACTCVCMHTCTCGVTHTRCLCAHMHTRAHRLALCGAS